MGKVLLWVVLGLAVLWGGYWFVGAHLIERQLHDWVAQEQAAGNRAEFSVLRVQGFPSRFDIHAEQIDLYNPGSGWGWRAPIAEVAALSYQPQHYIAVLPHRQQLETPLGRYAIQSDDLRASLVFLPGPSFVLNRSSLVAEGLVLRPGGLEAAEPGAPAADALLSVGELRFATRRATGDPLGHRLGLQVTGLELAAPLLARQAADPAQGGVAGAEPEATSGTEPGATSDTEPGADGAAQAASRVQALAGLLAGSSGNLHLDATLGLDRRLDRHALLSGQTRPTRLRLDDLTADWGPLAVTLTGELAIDAEGLPQGTLAARLTGAPKLLQALAEAGVISQTTRRLLERSLRLAAAAGGGAGPEGELATTLTFRDGMMLLGALPLGPAPRLPPR